MEPNVLSAKKSYSRAGIALFVFLLTTTVTGNLFTFLAARFMPAFYQSPYFIWVLNIICQYLLAFPAAVLVLRSMPVYRAEKTPLNARYFFLFFSFAAAFGWLGGIAGNLAGTALSRLVGVAIGNTAIEMISNSRLILCYALVTLVGPIVEELLFRRLLIDRLRVYGEWTVILFSGLTFGLVHLNIYQFFYATALGMLFAYIYLRSGNILYPIVLHCTFNVLFGLIPQLLNSNNIDQLSSGSAQMPLVTVTYLFSMFRFFLAATGLILFLSFRHRIFTLPSLQEVPTGFRFRSSVINLGVILYLVLVFADSTISIARLLLEK